MKDLDFDELDRAVASALNTSTTTASPMDGPSSQSMVAAVEPAPAPSEPEADSALSSISAHAVHSRLMPSAVPSTRTTLARKPAEVGATATPASADASSEPETTPSPIGAAPSLRRTIPHREGRFMDVMRSSSPQLPRPTQQPPAQDAALEQAEESSSRPEAGADSATNTHLEAAINELLASEGHTPPMVVATPQPVELPVPTSIELTPSSLVTPPVVSDEESLESIAADLGKSSDDTPEVAQSGSPFLAGAKVEKRPLGVADDSTTQGSELGIAAEPTIAAPETENTPIPEELQSDLMAIESAATQDHASTEAPSSESKSSDSPVQTSVASGPTSIARQYKEQPRTASEDDESGAIFDPQTYQQPIEHPAKKSSGWGWVIGIIVIILLAVAAAVAAWFGGILPVQL